MKTRRLLAAMFALTALTLPAFAAEYAVDPVHSFPIFRIKHMNAGMSYGRFNDVAGTVTYDAAAPETSKFDITIKVDSIDTHNERRDAHLKSPQFFNAKEFPTITFKSTATKKIDDTHLEVTGDLTLHGVTKSITTKIEVTGTGKLPNGTEIVGFETVFDIKRSEYGMKELLQGASDDVRIIFSFEVNKK